MNGLGRNLYMFLALSQVCAFAADPENDPVAAARQMVAETSSVRSPSGRFLVVAQDRMQAYDFVRWAEDLAVRLERLTGAELPSGMEPVLKAFFLEDETDQQSVSIAPATGGYTVHLTNYSSNLVESAMEAVSWCCMQMAAERRYGRLAEGVAFPGWLSQGIAQNLYAEIRKRNSEYILEKWRSGMMPSLQEIMGVGVSVPRSEDLRMARGVFVAWLISFGRDKGFLNKVSEKAVAKSDFGSGDLLDVLSAAGIKDLDQAWDAWMLRQKRTIFLPGDTTVDDLVWLRRQLLIYPDDFDKGFKSNTLPVLGLEDLLEFKSEEWVHKAAGAHLFEMQLKSAGRSDEIRDVVSALALYLEGVLSEEADWRLKRRLKTARVKFQQLEDKIMNADFDGKDANGGQEINEQKGQ